MARPRAVKLLLAAAVLLSAIFASQAAIDRAAGPAMQHVRDSVGVIVLVLCVWRAVAHREQRTTWAMVAAAFLAAMVGNQFYVPGKLDGPTVADAFWLTIYPLLGASLLARVRASGARDFMLALDGLVATLAMAAVSAALVLEPLVSRHGVPLGQTIVYVAYPTGDLVLAGLTAQCAALNGWRLEPSLRLMAAGLAVLAVTDTVYAYETLHANLHPGSWQDIGWPVSWTLVGLAAWRAPGPQAAVARPGWRLLAIPMAFALVALVLLGDTAITARRPIAAALAAGALLCVLARFVLTFRSYLAVLRAAEQEATTDQLTGLGNRRALTTELERVVGGGEALLALFDLNGFKAYNDTFGHPAGDALLARLGRRLGAVVDRAFRMGGDEFCVLLSGAPADRDEQLAAALAALHQTGDGFEVSAACGTVAIPAEAQTASDALRLADQRMYREKRERRVPAEEQTMQALLHVLRERQPDLEVHCTDVAELAVAVGGRLGLDRHACLLVRRAAELHDIGKAAIPDAVLNKPGPLDETEWAFMRRHTLIGERIVARAEALAPVGPLIRSSHERWDGGGYPDGLRGEQIPLGARIVAVCDAYAAITTDRVYRAGRPAHEALVELRRCAGTQFDPAVVETFAAVLAERDAPPAELRLAG